MPSDIESSEPMRLIAFGQLGLCGAVLRHGSTAPHSHDQLAKYHPAKYNPVPWLRSSNLLLLRVFVLGALGTFRGMAVGRLRKRLRE